MTGLTINEMALQFWQDAEKRYRLLDGSPSRELEHYQYALEPLLDLYGHTLGREYGPRDHKAIRQRLLDKLRFYVRFRCGDEVKDRWLGEKDVRAVERLANWKGEWLPIEILTCKSAITRKVINQRMAHIERCLRRSGPSHAKRTGQSPRTRRDQGPQPSGSGQAMKLVVGWRKSGRGPRSSSCAMDTL